MQRVCVNFRSLFLPWRPPLWNVVANGDARRRQILYPDLNDHRLMHVFVVWNAVVTGDGRDGRRCSRGRLYTAAAAAASKAAGYKMPGGGGIPSLNPAGVFPPPPHPLRGGGNLKITLNTR